MIADHRSQCRWPNLIIAGAQKAGTTWLHYRLARHPRISMSEPKELFFFGRGEASSQRERDRYRSHFRVERGVWFYGESTPSYLWHRDASSPFSPSSDVVVDPAEEVVATLGDEVLVVVLLRDPVSRAIAGARHQMIMGRLEPDVDIFEADAELGIIDLGFYRRHLEHWRSCLDPGQIRTFLFDDIRDDPHGLLAAVLTTLGLDIAQYEAEHLQLLENRSNTSDELRARHGVPTDRRLRVSPSTVESLLALYAEDIAYVEELQGRSLPAWRDRARLTTELVQ